jgi:hypothetical protein
MLTMHVLEQPLVLDLVLQYAGPDQWLFLGAVSKAWAALHTSVMSPRLARKQRGLPLSVVHTKITSFAEAVSSLARALYACDCDASLKTDKLLLLSRAAAFHGSSAVLRLAKATIVSSKWLPWHQKLCMAAAAGNQLATLQELHTSGPEYQPEWLAMKVATKAAECADLSMLQWMLAQQPEWTAESIETVAAGAAGAADAIEKITWLCQRFPANRMRLRLAFALATMKCGAVPTLEWLALSGFLFTRQTFTTTASEAGQAAVLRYLVEEWHCPWDVAAVRKAAVSSDSAEMLEWASSADEAVWSTSVLSELLVVAGQKDKLSAAAWLRAAGAEWPTSFLYRDLFYKSTVWLLRAMKWARANGCPWGVWDHTMCTEVCSDAWHGMQLNRQATQDAVLWAQLLAVHAMASSTALQVR